MYSMADKVSLVNIRRQTKSNMYVRSHPSLTLPVVPLEIGVFHVHANEKCNMTD